MARAGETPEPVFQQGTDLSYGQAGAANDLVGLIPPANDSSQDFAPKGDTQQFLFSPSDRPNEPVTSGMPHGPGPNGLSIPNESFNDFKMRTIQQFEQDPNPPKEVTAFIQRVAKGF